MNIRAATPDDIAQMIALERVADSAAHWGEGHYKALFESAGAGRISLVAEIADQDLVLRSSCQRICGFIVARSLDAEWEIENVIVEGAVRRNGIGSGLLGAVITQARAARCDRLYLEVRESNEAARKLYKKHGFKESGARRNYYSNPTEDAVLLELEIR